jgi:hypothetical protein
VLVVWSFGLVFSQEAPSEFDFTPTPTETEAPTPTELPPSPTPTLEPTLEPTVEPTLEPTPEPTVEPTLEPTQTPEDQTDAVTPVPTVEVVPTFEAVTPPPRRASIRGRGARVDADLLALYDALSVNDIPAAQRLATENEMLISTDGARVRVEVAAIDAAEAQRLRPLIEAMGGVYLIGFEHFAEYDFPLVMLDALNALPGQFTVSQPLRPEPTSGVFVSEGAAAVGVQAWHARGYRGQGVRIGVIDVGFFGYPNTDTRCVRAASSFDPLPDHADDLWRPRDERRRDHLRPGPRG